MKRLQERMIRATERLGWQGVVGVGLLAFVAAFYFSAYRPEQMRLEELRLEVARLGDARTRPARQPLSVVDKLDAFYREFPPSGHVSDSLEKIFAAADEQAITLEQGEYRAVRDSVGRLSHYQVILPLRGTYPRIRKFVASALAQVRSLSLESIQFERQKVGDQSVEAKVKLVMYMERGS
jgi:hypothetical protein